eukprot:Opistho-1_new@10927
MALRLLSRGAYPLRSAACALPSCTKRFFADERPAEKSNGAPTPSAPFVRPNTEIFERILSHFPSPITYAVAYGSGVFLQPGNDNPQDNMLDFIFAVEDAKDWHRKNIRANPSHYSAIRFLGAGAVTAVQRDLGAPVYYNTRLMCEGRMIKYGVVATEDLLTDLVEWTSLYFAGRLQKPVLVLRDCARVRQANLVNRSIALTLALLTHGKPGATIQETDVYRTIAGFSYGGDFRMRFGEDPKKVDRIVHGSLPGFQAEYRELMLSRAYLKLHRHHGTISFSNEYAQERPQMIRSLPSQMRRAIMNAHVSAIGRIEANPLHAAQGPSSEAVDELIRACADAEKLPQYIRKITAATVAGTSFSTAAKGVITAGFSKAIAYANAKVDKMRKGSASPSRSSAEGA